MLRRLNRLTLREVRLAGKAAWALIEARYRLRHTSVEEMRCWAALSPDERISEISREPLIVAYRRAVQRLGGTCLVRALALQRFLAQHGHVSELRIGVTRSDKGFEAHAWLIDGEEVLEGGGHDAGHFTLLAAWPSGHTPQ